MSEELPISVTFRLPFTINRWLTLPALLEAAESVAEQYGGVLTTKNGEMLDEPIVIKLNFPDEDRAQSFLDSKMVEFYTKNQYLALYSKELEPPELMPFYVAVIPTVLKEFSDFRGSVAFLPNSSQESGRLVLATASADGGLAQAFTEKVARVVEIYGKLTVENGIGDLGALERMGHDILSGRGGKPAGFTL